MSLARKNRWKEQDMKKERKWKNWAFFTKCRCWWTFWHIGRSGAVWGGCVCFGQAFAFVTTTGQAGWAVTPEALAAHSHLSTPISAACVPLSGLHKQDGAWREDDKKRKRERERVGEQQDCDGMEQKIARAKSFTVWSETEWSCVWICSDRSVPLHQCVGWLSTNVLHCPPSFSAWLVSHSLVSQCFHHFNIWVY